jgi:CHASE3 domain sensor protein
MTILGKRQKKKTNPLDIWLGDLANFIASRMKLNEYKRLQLKADLDSADMTVSPEQYVANAIVKALFIGVFAIPFLFFAPIISALVIVIAVVTYFSEYKKVGNVIKDKRQKIEYELPRLVSNIDKTLTHSRDVLGILDSYREHAGEELRRELDITVADMRSGNYEVALTRLESRVGSSMMSDVTRGLISVIHGDKTDVYWGNLVLKFSDYQRTLLKNEANKAPKKVRKLSMALLFCFMLVYVVVIGQVLITSLGGMFG